MSEKILIVDDEPDFERLIRQLYRKQLRKNEFTPLFASNGKQALEIVQNDAEIRVILTDINMPEMDGLTFLDHIQKLDRQVPVVVVSAYGDLENIRAAMNRGAFDFLIKPIDFGDLEATRLKALDAAEQIANRRRLVEEKRQLQDRNRFVEQTFGRYLDESVVQQLLDSPDALRLGGERRNVTILMSDLRGFSVLAERNEAETVVRVINQYLSSMIDIILEHKGIVDEIIGDAIMAIFGAPVASEGDAERAVACALSMQKAMAEVNAKNQDEGLPALEMGIGINTGDVVIGNIGSDRRAKYGAVGRHVNLAARIENRTVGGQVIVSQMTVDACREGLIDIGHSTSFTAKGFDDEVTIHDVVGIGEPYNVALDVVPRTMTELPHALLVEYNGIENGAIDPVVHMGEVTHLGDLDIKMHASSELRRGETLRLGFNLPGHPRIENVYGRVTEDFDEAKWRVAFTSMPPEAKTALKAIINEPSAAGPDTTPTAPPPMTTTAPAKSDAAGETRETLRQLTAGIAHELRSPIGFVKNFSMMSLTLLTELEEELGEGGADMRGDVKESCKELIQMISENTEKVVSHANRSNNIIEGMINRARGIEADRLDTEIPKMLDVSVDHVMRRIKMKEPGFEVSVVRNYGVVPSIRLEPLGIRRAFSNIITNALHAMISKTKRDPGYTASLVISVYEAEGFVITTIRDNGVGMSPETVERVFEPYYTTKVDIGVGLGMSLTHETIVDHHGGTLRAESKQGEYSMFEVRLPIQSMRPFQSLKPKPT